jgi:RNA polymerase sigma-70 factor (ECF subfamily)
MQESLDSDASLVRQALAGDVAALDFLLRKHARAAYLVALARLGEPADAEDACQEALVRCVEHLSDCRTPEHFGAWLMQIVRNTSHNWRERLRVRATEPLDDHQSLHGPAYTDDRALRAELRTELWRALERVTPVQREVVLLHDLEGMRHVDVADRLGISVTMSRRHLSDARETLRASLSHYRTILPDHD